MQSNHILMFIYITLHHLYQWNYTLDALSVLDHNYTIQTRTCAVSTGDTSIRQMRAKI